mgnify:CR=1 FL=1
MNQKKLKRLPGFLASPYNPYSLPIMNTNNSSPPKSVSSKSPHPMSSSHYANALKNIFSSPKKVPKTNKQLLYTMPKGWILLDKQGNIHENRTQEEIDDDEYDLYTQKQHHYMNVYTNRFIDNTIFDMTKNGYTYEEIDAYLEELFNDEDYDEHSDDENNDSQDNDYDSGYDSL